MQVILYNPYQIVTGRFQDNSVLRLLINFVGHTVLNNRITIHDKLEQASKEVRSN